MPIVSILLSNEDGDAPPVSYKHDHPPIVRLEGVCGGEPVVDGLHVTVRHVATLHVRGETIPEIAEALGLTEAQVFHASLRSGTALAATPPTAPPSPGPSPRRGERAIRTQRRTGLLTCVRRTLFHPFLLHGEKVPEGRVRDGRRGPKRWCSAGLYDFGTT